MEKPVVTNTEAGALESQVDTKHLDQKPNQHSSEGDDNYGFTPEEQRNITRRIDRRLVVTMGAMYCVSLMDRTNMSAVNIAGMSTELVLTGFRYVSVLNAEKLKTVLMMGRISQI
jgi:hypothetical protein